VGVGPGGATVVVPIGPEIEPEKEVPEKELGVIAPAAKRTLRISGVVPPEVWNRLGTRLIPKLKSGSDLQLLFSAKLTVDASAALSLKKDLEQALADLGLSDRLDVDIE
jgi:hypothetical protein